MNFKNAARTFVSSTALVLATLPSSAGSRSQHARVEVAFVLDTTGSMGDLIAGAKAKIWSIASTVVDANPDADIAMALVAYRDRGDDYVVKATPLSEDIQGLYGKLVKLEADGGDDTPESVNAALDKAISGLQWSAGDDVKRIVFLVGDAPPHMDYAQERQYPAILKTAAAHNIVVNTVQAGDMPETTQIWKEIAQFGHGRYMSIPQSGGEVTVVITPFDDEILSLQRELDGSVVPYGNDVQQGAVTDKMREKAAAPASAQLDNSKFYSKRAVKREVITGGGDLIADLDNKAVALDTIKTKDLPKELAAKPEPERRAWVESRLAARKNLQTSMAALIAKRDAFITAQKTAPATADSFDRAVEETLKVQLN